MISMRRLVKGNCLVALLVLAVVVAGAPAPAPAGDRWCYANHPDAVFCDDFDQYCCPEDLGCTGEGLPPDPTQTCEPIPGDGCWKSNARALEVWVPIACGARINLQEAPECGDGDFVNTPPFGAKYPKGNQGQHNVNLAAYINAKYGGPYNCVIGTDENPLVLEIILNGQTYDKLHHANTYIELALVDGVNMIDHRAPTDYVFDDLCVYEPNGININHPIICQQDVPPAGCPDIATAPHYASIAVGALAYLDKTPCAAPSYLPTNEHLAVFDGYKWWSLPASFTGEGDFVIGDGENLIRLTLWETTMKVELTNSVMEYSWCDMPRDYQGEFNKLSLGFGMACLIDLGSWTCAKDPGTDRQYQCIPTVSYSQDNPVPVGPVYDNVVLFGGEGYMCPTPPFGACCLTNGDCTHSTYYECETFYGGVWRGGGTSCAAEKICCGDPFADTDWDGDVDQQDFGVFQACFTGPGPVSPVPTGKCTCFDRDLWGSGDEDVDADDFVAFEACLSGPTVPANPACDD